MKRIATTLTALLLMAGTATAQDYGQARTLKIWDNKTAPHGNGIATPEREPEKNRLTDVSEAVLYIFPAAPEKATGQAVVICPGGGYVKLCIDYEGYEMAQWFAEHGITAAVLKYRMPNGHPEVPLEDVEQALRIMMGLEAGATGFTADKVGIVGERRSRGGEMTACRAAHDADLVRRSPAPNPPSRSSSTRSSRPKKARRTKGRSTPCWATSAVRRPTHGTRSRTA